jgi:hypothetical protein
LFAVHTRREPRHHNTFGWLVSNAPARVPRDGTSPVPRTRPTRRSAPASGSRRYPPPVSSTPWDPSCGAPRQCLLHRPAAPAGRFAMRYHAVPSAQRGAVQHERTIGRCAAMVHPQRRQSRTAHPTPPRLGR